MITEDPRLPELVRLSNEVEGLGLPQQADKFVKMLRIAVREGKVAATYVVGERFELPKQYRFKKTTPETSKLKRHASEQEGYTRRTQEMMILKDEGYQQWHAETKQELTYIQNPSLRPENQLRLRGTPTADALLEDTTLTLFWRSVEATRERIARQEAHGRRLATGKGFITASSAEATDEETDKTARPKRKARGKGRTPEAEDTKATETPQKPSRQRKTTSQDAAPRDTNPAETPQKPPRQRKTTPQDAPPAEPPQPPPRNRKAPPPMDSAATNLPSPQKSRSKQEKRT